VDDDLHFLNAVNRLLRKFHTEWDLIFAESVDQAIDIARIKPPDVVASDYQMPFKNGFDLVRELRALPVVQDATFIIVTGNKDEAAKRQALDLGATDLLNKPVNLEDLAAPICSSLRLKEYQDTIRRHNEKLEQPIPAAKTGKFPLCFQQIWSGSTSPNPNQPAETGPFIHPIPQVEPSSGGWNNQCEVRLMILLRQGFQNADLYYVPSYSWEEQQFQSFVSWGDGAAVVTLRSMNFHSIPETGFA
jgi:CheY-like chemotaxis protein